jgi:ABC-2 type transport system permease protein
VIDLSKYFWYATAVYKNSQVYRIEVFLRVITSLLMITALRDLWKAIYLNGNDLGNIAGIPVDSMMTYATVSIAMGLLFRISVMWDISSRVASGDIILDLQKPWNYQLMQFSRSIGTSLFMLIYVVFPLLVVTFIIDPIKVPSGESIIAFIISLIFAYMIAFSINFLCGLLAFVFTEIWGFSYLEQTLIQLCSGSFIPLWFFPNSISWVLSMLPFKGMYYIPLSIYIGTINGNQIFSNLLFQIIWLVILSIAGYIGLKYLQRLLLIVGG